MKLPSFKRHELSWICLAYLACSALLTLPYLRHPTRLFGEADVWQVLWNFWWVREALFGGMNLFFTPFLHWPNGISLVFHTLSLSNAVPALALQPIFGLVGSLNVLTYFHFVAGGVAMYVLVRYLAKSRLAAFAAGYLFTFSHYHIMRSQGHLNLFTMEGIPLYIYFLYRLREKPSWKYVAGAAAAMAYTGYADLYYILYLFLFTILFMASSALQRATWAFFKHLIFMGIIGTIALTPLIAPLLHQKLTTTDHEVYGHDPLIYSADVQSFFIPGMYSLYRNQTAAYWNRWTGTGESQSYIGYGLLALALLTIFKRHRNTEVRFWTAVATVFFVISLGPYLHVAGTMYRTIPLPYLRIMDIPLLSIGGIATRFAVIGLMSLTVLAAMALARIQLRFTRGALISAGLFVLVAIELLPAPIRTSPIAVPDFYRTLAQDTAQFAIVDLSEAPAKVMYYQTIHHKPLVGGYTSRPTVPTQKFLRETPVLMDLYADEPVSATMTAPKDGATTLKNLRIIYILIPSGDAILSDYLKPLNLRTVGTSDNRTVYQVY